MTLASRPPRGRTAVPAGLRFASVSGAEASSGDAWEAFQQDVESACLGAAIGRPRVRNTQVNPYGSETYGSAVMSGVEPGASASHILGRVYDRRSQSAEISSLLDR